MSNPREDQELVEAVGRTVGMIRRGNPLVSDTDREIARAVIHIIRQHYERQASRVEPDATVDADRNVIGKINQHLVENDSRPLSSGEYQTVMIAAPFFRQDEREKIVRELIAFDAANKREDYKASDAQFSQRLKNFFRAFARTKGIGWSDP